MDIGPYNRKAWDAEVELGNPWTVPVSAEAIARARDGDWQIVLTPSRAVPRDWFPALPDLPTLCLASGGGQQGPILAAAGARMTVLDNSPKQLAREEEVARRDGLQIDTQLGDMRDLSRFADNTFGLIVHPVSNCFVPEIRPVWRECFRVLTPGGVLVAGFTNPVRYLFDEEEMENGRLVVRNRIPYSDLEHLSEPSVQRFVEKNEPLAFSHTLEDQIGGQLDAGLRLTAMYEDGYPEGGDDALDAYMASFIATRSVK